MKKFGLSILPALVLGTAMAATPATAAVLYDNGPINGTIGAYGISANFEVSNSFTLTQSATVTGVNFGAWTFIGQTLTSVDFGIATTSSSFPVNATATSVTNSLVSSGFPYDVSKDSFATGNISLAAGTYYLVLQNAGASGGGPVYWDINAGPSSAFLGTNGSFDGVATGGSESFQILGVTSAVPEPSTWAMMILGFAGLGFIGYRRRKGAFA